MHAKQLSHPLYVLSELTHIFCTCSTKRTKRKKRKWLFFDLFFCCMTRRKHRRNCYLILFVIQKPKTWLADIISVETISSKSLNLLLTRIYQIRAIPRKQRLNLHNRGGRQIFFNLRYVIERGIIWILYLWFFYERFTKVRSKKRIIHYK